jgi:amino acid transporter
MANHTGLANVFGRCLILGGELHAIKSADFKSRTNSFAKAGMILGLAVLGNPEYEILPWHQTLLTIAIVAFSAFFNIFFAARLPVTEAIVLVLHIAGVFVIIIPLWVTAPRGNAYDTIFKFTNGGGWDSDGLSCVIGIVPMIGMLIVSITDIFVAVDLC